MIDCLCVVCRADSLTCSSQRTSETDIVTKRSLPPAPKSDEELQREHERFLVVTRSLTALAKTAIIACGTVAFGYVTFYLPILASSGKETAITQTISFLSDIKMNVLMAWGAAAGTTLWAMNERRMRFSERSKATSRNRVLEKNADPSVSSSGLDPSGTRAITDGK